MERRISLVPALRGTVEGMMGKTEWTQEERAAADDRCRELFHDIASQFPELSEFDYAKTLAIDLQCHVTALREALESAMFEISCHANEYHHRTPLEFWEKAHTVLGRCK